MRIASSTPVPPAKLSNDEVMAFAKKVGVAVVRLGPAWSWWTKSPDGQKTLLAKNNAEAFDALKRMLPEPVAQATSLLRLWSGSGEGFLHPSHPLLQGGTPAEARVFACAPSKAALLRMLHAYRGTSKPSFRYRLRTYWSDKWDTPMAGIAAEPGLWVLSPGASQPLRVTTEME